MIKTFHEIIAVYEKKYEYACLMAELSFGDTNWLADVINNINTEDLYKEGDNYGVELFPHITILYGIHANEVTDSAIIDFVSNNTQAINIKLEKISLFQNERFDVLKFDIEYNSDLLVGLNARCKESFPYTSTFPTYVPHCTIAYLNPGAGAKYVQTLTTPIVADCTTYLYSKPDGTKLRIPNGIK